MIGFQKKKKRGFVVLERDDENVKKIYTQ